MNPETGFLINEKKKQNNSNDLNENEHEEI